MKQYKGLFVPYDDQTDYREIHGQREYVRKKFGGKTFKLVSEDNEFAIQQLRSMGYDEFRRDNRGLWARKSGWAN